MTSKEEPQSPNPRDSALPAHGCVPGQGRPQVYENGKGASALTTGATKVMLIKPTPILPLIALCTVALCGAQTLSQQELERRIAFADAHFASPATKGQVVLPATAGSQTDRGRAYIALGPPDQVKDLECRPNTDCLPWEEWTYRDIPKIGRDVCIVFWDLGLNNYYKFVELPCDAQRGDEAGAKRRSEQIRKLIQQTLARVGRK